MSHSTHEPALRAQPAAGRRTFLQWFTYATGVVAAAILAVPFVGYLLGPLRKHRTEWVGLGPASQFPVNETRLKTFDNPLRQPWDGSSECSMGASPAGCRRYR